MDRSKEIKKLCQEKQIRMIDFKMTDIDGRWRHITIPVERFGEDTFTYGIGFDGSNYGYAPIEKSDMVFLPDPDTAYVDPFASVPTLTMCGNVCTFRSANTDLNMCFCENTRIRINSITFNKDTAILRQLYFGIFTLVFQ